MSAGLEARLQQLINRMGKSGDAAGILTLFAHLAELEARLTLARAAKLDNLDALISSRAAAADWTAARAGKLDLIGSTSDGSGVATLFGKLAAVLADTTLIKGYTDQVEGFVDTLESNLGTTGDAANAGGTVLARLAELLTNRLTSGRAGYLDRLDAAISSRAAAADYTAVRAVRLDYIQNWAGKIPQFASYQVVGQGTWQTVLNVAGAGFLLSLCQLNPAGILKITIDGIEKLNKALGPYNSTVDFAFTYLHRFNSSLNIQIMNNSGEGTSTVGVGYILD